ncbi:hypothetical protein D9619_011739 [Psilocybe cf. subviscida]|uniref:Uncharacterized protein n=1 Tax=Psilocybe cf. subviscida TaxID=2480587 RepID=A0A8H5B0F8_9AGAR|nr:hypothetical protein D9619_011739 [Psilocybe cf. subviscida]
MNEREATQDMPQRLTRPRMSLSLLTPPLPGVPSTFPPPSLRRRLPFPPFPSFRSSDRRIQHICGSIVSRSWYQVDHRQFHPLHGVPSSTAAMYLYAQDAIVAKIPLRPYLPCDFSAPFHAMRWRRRRSLPGTTQHALDARQSITDQQPRLLALLRYNTIATQ